MAYGLSVRWDIITRRMVRQTGYLLAADLVYADMVEAPSHQEVAFIIRRNRLGSLRGLVTAGQIASSGPHPDYPEVEAAFQRVYGHLESTIPTADRERLQFDAIMVEHLLCKFQRTKDKSRSAT